MQQQVDMNFDQQRAVADLAGLFGIVALILAAVGLYGVTAYTVEQRTSEIGVRMALGAGRTNVIQLILSGAFTKVAFGLVLGIPLAIGAGRLMSSQLFGVVNWDPRRAYPLPWVRSPPAPSSLPSFPPRAPPPSIPCEPSAPSDNQEDHLDQSPECHEISDFHTTFLGTCFASEPARANPSVNGAAPVAPRIGHDEVRHGATIVDNYYWLREKSNPKSPSTSKRKTPTPRR